jgi:hypothetical protein
MTVPPDDGDRLSRRRHRRALGLDDENDELNIGGVS